MVRFPFLLVCSVLWGFVASERPDASEKTAAHAESDRRMVKKWISAPRWRTPDSGWERCRRFDVGINHLAAPRQHDTARVGILGTPDANATGSLGSLPVRSGSTHGCTERWILLYFSLRILPPSQNNYISRVWNLFHKKLILWFNYHKTQKYSESSKKKTISESFS